MIIETKQPIFEEVREAPVIVHEKRVEIEKAGEKLSEEKLTEKVLQSPGWETVGRREKKKIEEPVMHVQSK